MNFRMRTRRSVFNTVKEAVDNAIETHRGNLVLLPPDVNRLSDEEEDVNEDLLSPNDIAGQVEVEDEDGSSDDDGEEQNVKKVKPKWKSGNESLVFQWPEHSDLEPLSLQYPLLANMSPAEIFSLFFDNDMKNMIIEQSLLYSVHRNNHRFKLSCSDLEKFIGVILLSGYHTIQREDDMWNREEDLGIPMVYNNITRQNYRDIKRYIHFVDNNVDLSTVNDKFWKVRPLLDSVNRVLNQFGSFCRNVSVDEQMLPYYGFHSCKQFIRGKPLRFGYKAWAMSCEHGYPFYVEIYQGKSNNIASNQSEYGNLGVGGNVVLNAVQTVLRDPKHHGLYVDNFFTSYALLRKCTDIGLRCTGTMRMNRTNGCPLPDKSSMVKKERGCYHCASDKNVVCVSWKDNAVVILGSNYDSVKPLIVTERRKKGGTVSLHQPKMVSDYNKYMGGADLTDRHVANLRASTRKRVWYWPVVKHCIEILRVAAFTLYK